MKLSPICFKITLLISPFCYGPEALMLTLLLVLLQLLYLLLLTRMTLLLLFLWLLLWNTEQ